MAGPVRQQFESSQLVHEPSSAAGSEAPMGLYAPKPVRRRSRRPAAMVGTVEAEIIPRLLKTFGAQPQLLGHGARSAEAPAQPRAAEFARIALTKGVPEACDFVDGLRGRGQSLERIYLEIVAPAARRLGDLWEADACDFVTVTVGLLRLQQVLHQFGLAFRREVEPREHGHRALLVPAPGEKDSFGHLMFGTFELVLAAEFLRRDGWDACVDSSASGPDAVRLVRKEWFDVVEVSLSSESHLEQLTAGIRSMRKASRNGALGVIVGGPVFNLHPEMVTRVGADLMATDGRQAAVQADNLMDLLQTR